MYFVTNILITNMWSWEHTLSDRNLLQNIYTVTNLVFGFRLTLITNSDFGIEGNGFENLIIKNKKVHYRDRKYKGEELNIQMPVFISPGLGKNTLLGYLSTTSYIHPLLDRWRGGKWHGLLYTHDVTGREFLQINPQLPSCILEKVHMTVFYIRQGN